MTECTCIYTSSLDRSALEDSAIGEGAIGLCLAAELCTEGASQRVWGLVERTADKDRIQVLEHKDQVIDWVSLDQRYCYR